MADFLPAFEAMILAEGGYVLHKVEGDRGGLTFAGISRNNWPDWSGWEAVDRGDQPTAEQVRSFYRARFWTPLQADAMPQAVATTIYDFAVNAGLRTATILAQAVVGTTPDGQVGPKTLEALQAVDPDLFVARYALAKLARYEQIVRRDRSQAKFLLGWLSRTLQGAAA
jgi:lysozyme family protein